MYDLKLIWVETSELYKGFKVKPHAHEYCHLYYIKEGNCSFTIENNAFAAEKGDIILALPEVIHEFEVREDPAILLEIKFTVFDAALLLDLSKLKTPAASDVHSGYFISSTVKYGRSRSQYFLNSAHLYLSMLLLHLIKDLHKSELPNAQLIDTAGFSAITINIINYIEENYMNEISLDKIAQRFDYNKHYICTAFKKDTNITIVDYLNFVRIRHAATLFSYSDSDLNTICKRVGFTNLSHFNHTFKKLTGMPPGHYKRMFPVDLNGNLQQGVFPQTNQKLQVQKISEIFGTLPSEKE